MRIMQVSYDRWPESITGVSVYCHGLEEELVRQGHQVYHLYSRPPDWRFRPYLKWEQRNGVVYVAIVNSPILWQFSVDRPLQNCSESRVERLFSRCLDGVQPDLVHFHAWQGLPVSLILLAKRSGAKVVVSLNDYALICPRHFLLRLDLTPCEGPKGGLNCLTFCTMPASPAKRIYRRLMVTLPDGGFKRAISYLRDLIRRGRDSSQWVQPSGVGEALDPSKLLAHFTRESFLKSALLEADAIIAPSRAVRAQFATHGIPSDRMELIPYPVVGGEAIRRRVRRFRQYPIIFGFLGRLGPIKGTDVFVEAARAIPPDQARFLLHGQGSVQDIDYLRGLAGNAQHIHFMGSYTRGELPAILETLDVLVFPSVVAETGGNVGLEGQAAGLPIIGSKIGGIPDYVQDGHNGFLFEPRSAKDLHEKIERFIQDPSLIERFSSNVSPPVLIADHVRKLLEVYVTTTTRKAEEVRVS